MRVVVVALAALLATSGCKGRDDRAAPPPPDAAVALRPRPAQLAHVTLKVLGMT
jgi:hypothetical protein